MKYFTADMHLEHANVISLSNRPFESLQEHNETLIRNWNRVVNHKDEIYILGDFLMSRAGKSGKRANELLKRLNGRKYFIRGNHDGFLDDPEFDTSLFEWIQDYHSFTYNGVKVVLFHYPILEWDCYYRKSIHLYGHVHNNQQEHFSKTLGSRAINVGVDMQNYTPVSIEALLSKVDVSPPESPPKSVTLGTNDGLGSKLQKLFKK